MAKPDNQEEHIQIVSLIDKAIITTITKVEKVSYNTEEDALSNKIGVILVALFSLFWLFSGGLKEIVTKHSLVIPICLTGVILCAFGWLLYSLTQKENNELKIGGVGGKGIALGRIGATTIYSGGYQLEWYRIKCIDMQKTGRQRYLLIETASKVVYKIKWENAFDWVSEAEFLDTLKTYSPNTIVNLPRTNTVTDKDDPRYTQLWLEYFANPNTRKKKDALNPGDTLDNGKYKIEGRRAQGGQGTVYLASQDNNQVIAKEYILPVSQGTSIEKTEAQSLEHEVKMLSSIDHPGIVKVLDCLIEDHRGYVILEYVKGHSLRELVKKEGPANQDQVFDWCAQIVEILKYLHNMTPPVVHRDLTPDNLMLDENNKIKLIDFTIAQHSRASRLNASAGKHAYMPPEQIKGEVYPANDYYALGCTIYYLLVGADPLPLAPSLPEEVASSISQNLVDLVKELTILAPLERLTDPTKIKNLLS